MRYLYLCTISLALVISCKQKSRHNLKTPINTKLAGSVFGTRYSVIYPSEIDYKPQFDSLFTAINASLSTYLKDSDISKINTNQDVIVDHHFEQVFKASKRIYKATKGVFDPTIGDVVNAWNFGADNRKFISGSTTIDSLMRFVGFNKVHLNQSKVKKESGTYLEFNAIAKGYGVDVIGDFLESKNIENYLVEIGGELRVRGRNLEKDKAWKVGLDEPRFDSEQSIYKVITLRDEAMATSGTYRKFKIDANGNRYAHIINTATGYPSKTNVLSVSVIAENCMTADAYATAFQAMGIESVKAFLKEHPELKVFFIFENEANTLETLALNGFPES